MRTVCDSTFLYDKETHVSPKLDEFAELVPELLEGGDHKLVVFSQWETMVFEAAAVLDRLGIGYVVLHGGLPGKDRKAVLETFHADPACRVFLSTDAGGTGLNLQTADTVVNLELPWNPAVLEQRIARVHRMGQGRPVRVVNLVTRGTIEERVLKTIAQKQNLFAGVFDGDEDEVAFTAANQPKFLDAVRELVGEPKPEPAPPAAGREPTVCASDAQSAFWRAGADMVAALNGVLEGDPNSLVDQNLRIKLRKVVADLLRNLDDSGG
jgi:superfamily II DNA/RNA helicase